MTATDIAKAVETFLNGVNDAKQFSQAVSLIVRSDLPKFDRKKPPAAFQISIFKGTQDAQVFTRSSFKYDYDIEVGIQKAMKTGDQQERDEATDFAEEVRNKFRPGKLGTNGSSLTKLTLGRPFILQQLNEADVFTGVVTLTFTVF